MVDVFDLIVSDLFEQLWLWILCFLRFLVEYFELVGLMNIEGCEDTEWLVYVYERYIEPLMGRVEWLLEYLADVGWIRRVLLRTFHFFFAHGGVVFYIFFVLVERFDPRFLFEPEAVDVYVWFVVDVLIVGLQLFFMF